MRNFLAPFILLFFMVGCAGMEVIVPETPMEKLVAAEVAYEGAINTVRDLLVTGVVTKGSKTADKIASAIIVARTGLDAWGVAPEDPTAMSTGLAGLKALQGILLTMRGNL